MFVRDRLREYRSREVVEEKWTMSHGAKEKELRGIHTRRQRGMILAVSEEKMMVLKNDKERNMNFGILKKISNKNFTPFFDT